MTHFWIKYHHDYSSNTLVHRIIQNSISALYLHKQNVRMITAGNIQRKLINKGSAQRFSAFYCIKNLGERKMDIRFAIVILLEAYCLLIYLKLPLLYGPHSWKLHLRTLYLNVCKNQWRLFILPQLLYVPELHSPLPPPVPCIGVSSWVASGHCSSHALLRRPGLDHILKYPQDDNNNNETGNRLK